MSNFLTKTYLVCNANMLSEFKKIEGFQVNLGMSLLNSSMQFNPADVNIQMHLLCHKEIIQMIGFLGSLQIYSCYKYSNDDICIVNDKNKVNVKMNSDKKLYDLINEGLNDIAKLSGYKVNINTENKNNEKAEEYVKPDKKFSEMTFDERIKYARNLK